MKTLQYVEKRVYLLEVVFDQNKTIPLEVHKALIEKFPEYKGTEYEYIWVDSDTGIIKVYRASTYDFVEV